MPTTDSFVRSPDDEGVVLRYMDMGDGSKAQMVVSMDRMTVAGGASTFRVISAASANAAVVKPTAAILYGIQMSNLAPLSATRAVKLYNQNTVPVASDVPAMVFALPPYACIDISRSRGVAFPAGLAISIVIGPLDGVFAAVGAGDVTVNINFT